MSPLRRRKVVELPPIEPIADPGVMPATDFLAIVWGGNDYLARRSDEVVDAADLTDAAVATMPVAEVSFPAAPVTVEATPAPDPDAHDAPTPVVDLRELPVPRAGAPAPARHRLPSS